MATVSVVAGDAWWAEVLAKAALVAGVTAGLALLESAGVDGVLVTDDGAVRSTAGFARWCDGPGAGAARPDGEAVSSGAGIRSS